MAPDSITLLFYRKFFHIIYITESVKYHQNPVVLLPTIYHNLTGSR